MVDDCRRTTHYLVVFESQEVFCLTALKRGILVALQRCHLVGIKVRHGKFVVVIEVVVELHELLQFLFCFDTFYCGHLSWQYYKWVQNYKKSCFVASFRDKNLAICVNLFNFAPKII